MSFLGASYASSFIVSFLITLRFFSLDIFCLGDFFARHLSCYFPLLWTRLSRMPRFVRDKCCQQHPIRLYRKTANDSRRRADCCKDNFLFSTLVPSARAGTGKCAYSEGFFRFWSVLFSSIPSVGHQMVLLCCFQAPCLPSATMALMFCSSPCSSSGGVPIRSRSCSGTSRIMISKAKWLCFLMHC